MKLASYRGRSPRRARACSAEQRGRRRPRRRVDRPRVHGARSRLHHEPGRPPQDSAQGASFDRHARLSLRRRVDSLRAGDAARRRSTGTAKGRRSAASWSCGPGRTSLTVVEAVKSKIAELAPSFPPGVELKIAYDRTELIHRAIDTLTPHVDRGDDRRGARHRDLSLPLSFGARADHGAAGRDRDLLSADVSTARLLEHHVAGRPRAGDRCPRRRLDRHGGERAPSSGADRARAGERPSTSPPSSRRRSRWGVRSSSRLVIIVVSFLPVFLLTGEEGRLFHPLAFTKTFAIAAASILSVTLVPILMIAWMRGRDSLRGAEPGRDVLPAGLLACPELGASIGRRRRSSSTSCWFPRSSLSRSRSGSEFMPQLREGSLMYMPTGLPMMSVEQARDVLVKTDGIIMTFPEVQSVLGKAGKFESSTDPAPIEMFETTIVLKPRDQWPKTFHRRWYSGWPDWVKPIFRPIWPEMHVPTQDELIASMNEKLQIPGMPVAWTQPIRNRLDMLATGVRTPGGNQGLRFGLSGDREGQPRDRERPEGPPRRSQRLRRAHDRWLLSRLRRGPRRRGPVRPLRDAGPEHARGGDRREGGDDDGRGTAPVHGSRPLPAGLPKRPGSVAPDPRHEFLRSPGSHRAARQDPGRQRTADVQGRERPALRRRLRGHDDFRPRRLRARGAASGSPSV